MFQEQYNFTTQSVVKVNINQKEKKKKNSLVLKGKNTPFTVPFILENYIKNNKKVTVVNSFSVP